MQDQTEHPPPQHAATDEIELIDILRVLWKWKYLILIGTLALAVISVLISSNRPKIYRIGMILQPGVIGVDEEGQEIYVDNLRNMQALIDAGTFDDEIGDYLEKLQIKNKPTSLKFRVRIQRGLNLLRLTYETQFVDTGKKMLNYLVELLRKTYEEQLQYKNDKHERNIMLNLAKIEHLKDQIRIGKIRINNIEERLKELELDINLLQNRNVSLINEKNSIIKQGSASDPNKVILYNNLLQNNLELINRYKDQFIQYGAEKENIEVKLKEQEEKIVSILWENEDLKKQKNSATYIKVLQSPKVSQYPIEPRPKVAAIISSVTGFFIMIFIAAFLEYVLKHGRKKTSGVD